MQTEFEGYYLDGRRAERQKAIIRITVTGLHVSTEGGAASWWPYEQIHQTQGFHSGEQMRLERGEGFSEVLILAGPSFLEALSQVAPDQAARFRGPARRQRRFMILLASIVGIVGIVTFILLFGIPWIVSFAAPRVPVSWEEHLGRAVVQHLAPAESRCQAELQARAIEVITQRLISTPSKRGYRFEVIVSKSPTVNAFAAPGGYVVIFQGLLELTESPEELAGVLAHEFQHVIHQHATKALLQHTSVRLLIAAIAGDVSSAMSYGLESAQFLATMRYSREHEEIADREGMKMILSAGIDPTGMVSIFKKLEREDNKSLRIPTYLSSHPDMEKRIELLKSMAGKPRSPSFPLAERYDWEEIRRFCAEQ